MDRTVYVARTAYDLTHVNRLAIPQLGVISLYLEIGGKRSKPYLIDTAPPQPALPNSSDDFHFVPELETPKIKYEIDDPGALITEAKLQLFHRGKSEFIWEKVLTEDEYTHGEHELDWNGKITRDTDFPEELITVEHSPYKLKLTIKGDGYNYSPAAWTYLHVLVHSLELELGPKSCLSAARDKQIWDQLKGTGTEKAAIPSGTVKKVVLLSNIFSTGADKADNTLYNEYQALWDNGPNIPIFANIYVKASDDTKKDNPKAIGKVRLLWDWEGIDEDVSIHFNKAREYIADSINYKKDKTKPKSDNCHLDRGGKRGDDSNSVFPAQAGYGSAPSLTPDSFPFKVERCSQRTWASYSETWRDGVLKGKTGVIFKPSRMAGDRYKIAAYFPHLRKPDGTDDLDTKEDKIVHAIQVSAESFQVWRELHLVTYCKKKSTIPSLNFVTVGNYYSKAYISVEDKTGGPVSPMAAYDTNLRAALAGSVDKTAALAAGDQGAITEAGAKFRSYADFKTEYQTRTGLSDDDLRDWLNANNVANVAAYRGYLEAIADDAVVKACSNYFSANSGINIFQFNLYWEAGGGLESGTNGFASTDFANTTRNKAGFIQCRVNYGAGSQNNMQQTMSHEMGHICFLPHAPGAPAGGIVAELHDQVSHWDSCIMSYNYVRERQFCGLCLLRMRGWDQNGLNSDSSKNKKT